MRCARSSGRARHVSPKHEGVNLRGLARRLQAGGIPTSCEVRFGRLVPTVIRATRDTAADLVVLAPAEDEPRGLRFSRMIGGLFRHLSTPILLGGLWGQRAA